MSTDQSLARIKNHLGTSDPMQSLSLRERSQASKQAAGAKILLLDTSYSMACYNTQGTERRVDILWNIVQDLRSQGLKFSVVEFNHTVKWSDSITKPEPNGGTDLAGALEEIARMNKQVSSITLVTDGQPDDSDAALASAAAFGVKINVLFAGDERDTYAQAFCRELAQLTNGQFMAADVNASNSLAIEAGQKAKLMLTEGSKNATAL